MHHKKQLNPEAVARGVRPAPGRAFAFVATVPASDGYDIVGAAQYVPAGEGDASACEFAITVDDRWHGTGLGRELLASLVRRARRDGYRTIEGLVMADNKPMLALGKRLKFSVGPAPGPGNVVRLSREL